MQNHNYHAVDQVPPRKLEVSTTRPMKGKFVKNDLYAQEHHR